MSDIGFSLVIGSPGCPGARQYIPAAGLKLIAPAMRGSGT
jgi:hypothetical protein